MAKITTTGLPRELRPYILYRPPVQPTWGGTRSVRLYTDNLSPDCFQTSVAHGRPFTAWVPAAMLAISLDMRTAAGAELAQSSTITVVRAAFDRAVADLGWTSSVFTPP